jgi:vacuolar-type H+-ATPase subunit H
LPQTITDTVKALTDFEAELDRIRAGMLDAKKRMIKDAGDWAEVSKSSALAEAQKLASERLSEARTKADAEAEEIRKKGQSATKKFAESISKHKKEASELVLRILLGEGQ